MCNHRALLTLHVHVVRPFSLSSRDTEVRAAFIGALTTIQAGDRLVGMPTVCLLSFAKTIQLQIYDTLLAAAVSRDTAFSILSHLAAILTVVHPRDIFDIARMLRLLRSHALALFVSTHELFRQQRRPFCETVCLE